MDRTLDRREQEKFCAARANYFNLYKRKVSSSQTTQGECTTSTSTSASTPITLSGTMSSSKRFKFTGITSTKPTGTASKTPLIVRFYDADIQARDAHGRTQEQILSWPDSELESCHNYIQMLFPVPEGSAFNWEAPIIDREVMETFRTRSDLRHRLRRSFERMLNFYGFEITVEAEQKKVKEEVVNTKEDEVVTEDGADASKDGQTTAATETESIDTTAKSSGAETTKQDEATDTSKPAFPPGATSNSSPFAYHVVRAENWRKNFRNWAVRFDHNHLRITRILRCLRVLGLQQECAAFFAALKTVFDDAAINISERSMMYWTRAVTRPLYIAPDDDQVEWLQEWEEEQEAKKDNDEKKEDVEDESKQEEDAKSEAKDE
ncbi:hypothetical protein EK21DRAFT_85817 [Setomelanomma holmii]|uniref:Opioid growth factor receptor (OGFr) conserved domain-containing protein n=1 Tax=Setomelanomma holmii TaxID=210430 RepID=A0A9P4HI59_9PLEO|nr:hypothetical protein EK21DRAFT_85817 [Setomelanomma holmii]